MGIQGLLPLLKSITKSPVHVSKYEGQRVAVDAYGWLHKAAYCCSYELCEGLPTDKFVTYCMKRVEQLQRAGVIPVIVFDGGRLPMKGEEEAARAKGRQENLEKARAHWAAGNTAAAYDCYQRAVDISPATAKAFIDALKAAGVEFIVAPYEADAQMAYLALNSLVHAVITEDSDMLAYGCPHVLFKVDRAGEGQEICAGDLPLSRSPSFAGFTHDMFLEMCILAGCDFLKALPSIGIKKAHAHIRKFKTFVRVCKCLRFAGVRVAPEYEAGFQRALWTFRHQRVFCPQRRQLVHLRPLPPGGLAEGVVVLAALPGKEEAGLPFLGPAMPDDLARAIADGDLDPMTKQPFPERPPVLPRQPLHQHPSLGPNQAKGHGGSASGGRKSLPVRANGIASYFPPVSSAAKRGFAAPRKSGRGNDENGEPAAAAAAGPVQAALEEKESTGQSHPVPGPSGDRHHKNLALQRSTSQPTSAHSGPHAQEAAAGSAAASGQTPAERAASHGTACSSQPERRALSVLRPPNLSRFSCRASMPAQAGGSAHVAAEPGPAQPEHQPRRPCAALGSPALSDGTLDFTTPDVRGGSAGATQQQQALFLEERLVCSERIPRTAAALSLDQASPSATDPGQRRAGASFVAPCELDSQQELEAAITRCTGSRASSSGLEAGQECGSPGAAGRPAAEDDEQDTIPDTVTPRQPSSRQAAAACMQVTPAHGDAEPYGGSLDADLGSTEALAPPGSSREETFLQGLPGSPRLEQLGALPEQLLHGEESVYDEAVLGLLGSGVPEETPLWAWEQQRQRQSQHSASWSGYYEGPDVAADADIQDEECEAAAAELGAVSPSPVRRHPLALAGVHGAAAAALRKRLGPNALQRLPGKRARAGLGSPGSGSMAAAMRLPASPTLDDALERSRAAERLHAAAEGDDEAGGQGGGEPVAGPAQWRHTGSIMQQLSAEEQQEEAALEHLLTPQQCARQQGRMALEELSAEEAREEGALERLLTPQRSRRQQPQQQPPAAPAQQHPAVPAAPAPHAMPLRSSTVQGAAPAASDAVHAEPLLHSPRRTTSQAIEEGMEAGVDADAVAEEADGEEEGAEPRDEFHSLRHVMPYAREAARAIDCAQEAAERGQRRRRLGSTAAVMQSASLLQKPFAPPRAQHKRSAEKRQREGATAEASRGRQPGSALFDKFKCSTKQRG